MHEGSVHHAGCCGGRHADDVETVVADALRVIRESGKRVTAPRIAMLRALANARSPLSVEEVRRAAGPGADLVTAYRTMESMEQLGLVRRHLLESGKNLYELANPDNDEHHHHVVCRDCGKMEPLPGCQASVLEKAAQKLGYTRLTHVLEVFGVCAKCSKKPGGAGR